MREKVISVHRDELDPISNSSRATNVSPLHVFHFLHPIGESLYSRFMPCVTIKSPRTDYNGFKHTICMHKYSRQNRIQWNEKVGNEREIRKAVSLNTSGDFMLLLRIFLEISL